MNFDLRLPIGLMFSLFGAMLSIFGLASDKSIYQEHSLGININLGWGVVLLLFGLFMLFLTWRSASQPKSGKSDGERAKASEPGSAVKG